jgi:hypothetical protein
MGRPQSKDRGKVTRRKVTSMLNIERVTSERILLEERIRKRERKWLRLTFQLPRQRPDRYVVQMLRAAIRN